jgi:hypothetical protein
MGRPDHAAVVEAVFVDSVHEHQPRRSRAELL